MKLFLVLASIFMFITEGNSQERKSGPSFQFGTGIAYSMHAKSYVVERNTGFSQGLFVHNNGVRLLATKIKAGWIFSEKIMAYYTLTYAPPNTTVTPYRSTYHGLAISWFPEFMKKWILSIGAGRNKANDKYGLLAKGILYETSIGLEANRHFIIELNSMFGRMQNDIEPNPLKRMLNKDKEFFLQLTVNYMFYRKPD